LDPHRVEAPIDDGLMTCRYLMELRKRALIRSIPNIAICKSCDGQVKVIACIEGPAVIEKILTHLERKDAAATT
jgi:hypothetical protein